MKEMNWGQFAELILFCTRNQLQGISRVNAVCEVDPCDEMSVRGCVRHFLWAIMCVRESVSVRVRAHGVE